MKSKKRNIIYLLALTFCLFACAEKQEGCLDIYATNFDFDADVICDDCCEYPLFELTVSHYWDSLNVFRYNNLIFETLDSLDTIRVHQLGFFISDIRLHTGTDSLGMDTYIEVPNTFGTNLFLESSINWINQKNLSGEDLGIILQRGEVIESVSFWVGFNPAYGVPDPIGLSSSNPVAIEGDSLNWSDDVGLLYGYMNFSRQGQFALDSVGVELLDPRYVSLDLESPVTLETGDDVALNLRLYYSNLFSQCNLLNANLEQISACLEENFNSCFQIISL
jgi:hypothetical protein